MKEPVLIYDCTLRDGTQAEEVSLSVEDKLRIAQRLDSFGIAYIEGGWPGSNPRDAEFFQRVGQLDFEHGRITAFGSTRHARNRVDSDPNLQALLEAGTEVVALVGKSWDLHVDSVLRIEPNQNLDMVRESVTYLKERGKEVIFDAEHFFDGYRSNPEYALEVLKAAQAAGADWLVLCDTNGGNLPSLIGPLTGLLCQQFPRIGIHTHNDCELGVANSVAAVGAGARLVQGTINGYGERVGNANLTSILPLLELKLDYHCVGEKRLQGLAGLAQFVSETANVVLPSSAPFVGRSAFAHKGGIHVNAVLKDQRTYEHTLPEAVGNQRRVLVSDLSGKGNLVYKLREFGDVDPEAVDLEALLGELKRLEFEGYQFEGAEASFRLLVDRVSKEPRAAPFACRGFRVIVDHEPSGQLVSEATVKLSVDGEEEHTAADGNGPVNALDRAIRKALTRFFPEIQGIRLTDYKVRVLDAQSATEAKVRVLVESTNGQQIWTTVGVSSNVIEASWKAINDSLLFGLRLARGQGKPANTAAASLSSAASALEDRLVDPAQLKGRSD